MQNVNSNFKNRPHRQGHQASEPESLGRPPGPESVPPQGNRCARVQGLHMGRGWPSAASPTARVLFTGSTMRCSHREEGVLRRCVITSVRSRISTITPGHSEPLSSNTRGQQFSLGWGGLAPLLPPPQDLTPGCWGCPHSQHWLQPHCRPRQEEEKGVQMAQSLCPHSSPVAGMQKKSQLRLCEDRRSPGLGRRECFPEEDGQV